MKKETVMKLLLLCGISASTIRYCGFLEVTAEELEAFEMRIFAEEDGRIEL